MTRKKAKERFFLDRFLEAAQLNAESIEERERPDFMVRTAGRSVGIELTQLFVPYSANGVLLQAQESIANEIVDRAWRRYTELGGVPAYVRIHFQSQIQTANRKVLADRLASVVHAMPLTDWVSCEWRPDTVELATLVSSVSATGVPHGPLWTSPRSGWVAPLSTAEVQPIIDEKASWLPIYRKVGEEAWLLIYCDKNQPSQFFDIPESFDPKSLATPFDRTFMYFYPTQVAIELGKPRA